MKKGALIFFITLAVLNFVSAQGISDFLNEIDQSTVILYAVFIISFSLLFFSLSKMFKDNKSTAGIISGILAFLLTYWVNKSEIDIEGFFFDIGISESAFFLIISLLIIGGIIFTIIKLKKNSLFVFGGLMILLSFFVYEKLILITLGIILLIVGFVLLGISKPKH